MSDTGAVRASGLRAALPHALMAALMVPMLVAHEPVVLLGTLVALLLVAAVLAVCARLGAACRDVLSDYLVMTGLVLAGLLAHVEGGHHGSSASGSAPVWLLDVALISGWALVRTTSLRRAPSARRARRVVHALLMCAQIVVMLIWCR